MQLAIGHRSAGGDVGDIEKMRIGAAREAHLQCPAHRRMGPVAAGDIERLDRLLAAIAMTELGYRPRLVLRHRNELHRPFHRDPQLHQVVDQQPLMDVLRQDQHIGIGRQPGADITQRHPPRLAAAHPQIDRGHHLPGCHRRSGKAELAVEFEGAGMNHQCPRGHPRRRRLVDDAEPDAQGLEPQGKDETGRAGTDDEDFRLGHGGVHFPLVGGP